MLFVLFLVALGTQHKRNIQWNTGLRIRTFDFPIPIDTEIFIFSLFSIIDFLTMSNRQTNKAMTSTIKCCGVPYN